MAECLLGKKAEKAHACEESWVLSLSPCSASPQALQSHDIGSGFLASGLRVTSTRQADSEGPLGGGVDSRPDGTWKTSSQAILRTSPWVSFRLSFQMLRNIYSGVYAELSFLVLRQDL